MKEMKTLTIGADTFEVVDEYARSQLGELNPFPTVKTINHKGFNSVAPENTIPAYVLSKKNGYAYVECDVSFTSDGVAVLLHDNTIDRTSNGSGNISAMTYAQASQYDFGSWKSEAYAGTTIPTLEEFILLCKKIGLHPYIELKENGAYTSNQIQGLVNIVKTCGMGDKVTWISFSSTYLGYVKTADTKARLGYVTWDAVSDSMIALAQGLQTGENEVFLDLWYGSVNAAGVALCVAADIPLEVFTVNDESWVKNMNQYITGVTSDTLNVGKILYSDTMDSFAYYTVTNNLTNAHNSNTNSVAKGGESYIATISPADGYDLVSVSVKMDGVDITSSVYADGAIRIKTVTGNIVITASAKAIVLAEPVVDLSLTNAANGVIANLGTGGATYDASISGTYASGSSGLTLNGQASAKVNYALSGNKAFSICVRGALAELSGNFYQRFARDSNDALAIYYSNGDRVVTVKLANADSGLTYVSDKVSSGWKSVLLDSANFAQTEEHTFIFVGSENSNLISLYVDGELIATQTMSLLQDATYFALGNPVSTDNSYLSKMTVADFKIWDRVITSAEIQELSEATNNGDNNGDAGEDSGNDPDTTLTIAEQWEQNGSADITPALVQGGLRPTEGAPYYSYSPNRVSFCGVDLVVSEGDVISISTSNNDNFQWGVKLITQAGVDSIATGEALIESGDSTNVTDPGWQTSDITIPENVVRVWFTFAKRNATGDSISPADLGTVVISKNA